MTVRDVVILGAARTPNGRFGGSFKNLHAAELGAIAATAPRMRLRSRKRSTPGITATHQYIDAMAMFLVKDPGQYQVIVTNNLFGDIITDIDGALQGGLGMAASGNIHPGKTSLFEPVHGADARDARCNRRAASSMARPR